MCPPCWLPYYSTIPPKGSRPDAVSFLHAMSSGVFGPLRFLARQRGRVKLPRTVRVSYCLNGLPALTPPAAPGPCTCRLHLQTITMLPCPCGTYTDGGSGMVHICTTEIEKVEVGWCDTPARCCAALSCRTYIQTRRSVRVLLVAHPYITHQQTSAYARS